MEIEKLFKVLVVGGGLLTAGSSFADQSEDALEEVLEPELAIAFCNPEDTNSCIENEDGEIVVKEGFFCCWGTSCN